MEMREALAHLVKALRVVPPSDPRLRAWAQRLENLVEMVSPLVFIDNMGGKNVWFRRGDTLADGRFEIDKTLGRGVHGVVFLVHDMRAPEKKYALKLGYAEDSDLDREFHMVQAVKKRVNDCAAAGAFIPRIYDFIPQVRHGGALYRGLVMQYIEGKTFADWAESIFNPQTEEGNAQFHQLAKQLFITLNTIHCAGVIHNDLHHRNILVSTEGNAYVTDFGTACRLVHHASDSESYQCDPAIQDIQDRANDVRKLAQTLSDKLPHPEDIFPHGPLRADQSVLEKATKWTNLGRYSAAFVLELLIRNETSPANNVAEH